MTQAERDGVIAVIEHWRTNADLMAEDHKGDWCSDAAAMQRACADQLAQVLAALVAPPKKADLYAQAVEYATQMADLLGPTSSIAEEWRLRRHEFASSRSAIPSSAALVATKEEVKE